MESKAISSIALLLTLNILFFTLVSSNKVKSCAPPSPPKCPTPSKGTPSHSPPSKGTPSHSPPSKGTPPSHASCPRDTLKLGVCGNLLNDLVSIVVGTSDKKACCSLLQGLADLDAAVCLCTAIKANILGIGLNVDVSLSLLLNYCGKSVPSGYQCA